MSEKKIEVGVIDATMPTLRKSGEVHVASYLAVPDKDGIVTVPKDVDDHFWYHRIAAMWAKGWKIERENIGYGASGKTVVYKQPDQPPQPPTYQAQPPQVQEVVDPVTPQRQDEPYLDPMLRGPVVRT